MFDHCNQIPLAVDITVQRLDINGALSVLGWVKPLFKYFYNDLFYYVSIISYSSCFIYIYIASVASVSANVNSVPILNGTNFKDWKRNMEIVLNSISLKHSLAMVCSGQFSVST